MNASNPSVTWVELSVLCPQSGAGPVLSLLEDQLLVLSPDGFLREDPDAPPGEREPPPVGYSRYTVYVTADKEEDSRARLQAAISSIDGAELTVKPLGTEWREGWKKYFRGFQASPRLWVRPPWEAPGTLEEIVIEPGMAFGTGQHETTRLCLESIDRLVGSATESMLDVGCGTGILSIGAYRLGVPTVVGVDCDPDAVRIAVENAEINAVATACSFSTTPIESVETVYPLVVANIMAAPLIGMAHAVTGCVAPGGRLLLSGILWHQADDVREAYVDAGVEYVQQIQDGEWVLIEFIRS